MAENTYQISFDYTEKDWLTYQKIHRMQANYLKNIMTGFRLVLLLLPIGYLSYNFFWGSGITLMEIIAGGVSIITGLLLPWYYSKVADIQNRAILKKGSHGEVLGQHTLIFSEKGVIAKAPKKEYTFEWKDFIKWVDADGYHLLYISKTGAVVIPDEKARPGVAWKRAMELITQNLKSVGVRKAGFVETYLKK